MEARESSTGWVVEKLLASTSTAPAELLEEVMADPRCPAFGPLHHFIVGATLLACWHNAEAASDREALLRADLEEMAARSSYVPGATCARWGVCGAAASAGMAYAIVRGNAPLREEGWQEGQLMVSELLALIAPRYVYVASAEDDQWADPKGEYLSACYAGAAYQLYEASSPSEAQLQEVKLHHNVGYHIRPGGHDVTEYDWQCFLDFCDKAFSR